MKFISAMIILAIAISANASAIAWGPSLTVSEPWGARAVLAAPASWASHASWGPSAWAPSAWSAPAAWAPSAWAAPHAAVVVAAPAHEGKYVAANRGSVHEAPLPGHTQSAQALNLQPAPGTW